MKKSTKDLLFAFWAVFAIVGIIGVYQRFAYGHALANYGSYVPWGLWVSCYIYFIGLSAGAYLLSSLIYVFDLEQLKKIRRIALLTTVVTLIMGVISIFFDLGHMWRFYELYTRFDFSSVLTWMVWLYTIFLILIFAELWFDMRIDLFRKVQTGSSLSALYEMLLLGWSGPDDQQKENNSTQKGERKKRMIGIIGIPVAIAFLGGDGALFGALSTVSYWNSALYPILFIIGAIASGGALLMAVVALFPSITGSSQKDILKFLGKVVLGLLLFDLLLEWSEFSIGLWYGIGHEYALIKTVLFGEYWYVFWIIHIALGSAIPIILLLRKHYSRWSYVTAGILVAVTYMAVRLNIVIPGQITPALENLEKAYIDTRLSFEYVPSLHEWAVFAFIVALGIGLFYTGLKILPLKYTAKSI